MDSDESTTGFNTNLFRCPSHSYLRQLDQLDSLPVPDGILRILGYRFSYTFRRGLTSRGMASWIPIRLDDPMNPVRYFKANFIRHPSDKIMLAEEASEDENEKFGARAGASENSAWDWGFAVTTPAGQKSYRDPVTLRHRSKGGVLHADGHVAAVGTNYWQSPRHYDPTWVE